MLKKASIAFSLLLVAACASKAPVDPKVAEVTFSTESKISQFDEYKKFQGPKHQLNGIDGYTLIRSWRSPEGSSAEHQLYIHVEHDGREKSFIDASKPGGKKIDIKRIDTGPMCEKGQRINECDLFEAVGIWIDAGELKRAAKENGLVFRLNAKRGEDVVVRIPAWYLKGYLTALKQ